MPAPIAPSTSATASSIHNNRQAPRSSGSHSKRRRFGRRRGRQPDLDSDEEVEREVRTDSESEDDLSSSQSTSDSDTEPASEDVMPNDQPRVLTPSTSQSPKGASHLFVNGHSQSFFGASGDWSEMVTNEVENGPESLPVIDFTELDSQVLPIPNQSRKSKKHMKQNNRVVSNSLSSPSTAPPQPADQPEQTRTPASHSESRRPAGQSARQAYQQRLEADPSYVPTVGEFWGHDDRLMDKSMRSMSGWWRERWQSGFRGRGGFGRGSFRGRGGFSGRSIAASATQNLEEAGVQPADRTWTHDGFEELKRSDDEQQRTSIQRQQPPPSTVSENSRGRILSFPVRGVRPGRAAFSTPFKTRQIQSDPNRVWFLKKPEHMWTKQAESFLFSDPSFKQRGGHSASVRVKLPNQKTAPIRVPLMLSSQASTSKHTPPNPDSEAGDRSPVVRIPKSTPFDKPEIAQSVSDPPVVDEPSIEEVFTVRPRLVSPKPIPLPEQLTNKPVSVSLPNETHNVSSSISSVDPAIQQKLEQLSLEPTKTDHSRWVQTEEAVLRNPTGTVPDDLPEQHVSPMQYNYSSSEISPSYGSPYQYAPSLPPGLAINSAGMPYEVATGRPVYLQPTSSMYTPPMMQPVPFVPGHVHHHSAVSSSDFLPTGTPPINGGGYMEYTPSPPLFSFPRQSSRIQIRAPDEPKQAGRYISPSGTANTSQQPSSSGLRSDAAAFEPSEQYSYDGGDQSAMETQQQQVQDPIMGYYSPYYYPDPSYGYNPYLDMSQVAPYEMYPPQGTVYYQ
ncbi:hypothetical protein C8R42DRAFT_723176 [Lentinula raphanica]|nr:hypothetical protein C8R42DRAFT_723176 [Lentinula raphanica]